MFVLLLCLHVNSASNPISHFLTHICSRQSEGDKLIIIIMKNIIMNIATKQKQDQTVQTFLKNYVIFTKLRSSEDELSSMR